jgi:putative addiction module killer protein
LRIERYQNANGRVPFREWLDSLDARHRVAVHRRINVLEEHDHFADCRSLQDGLFELRLIGPGLRVYFAQIGHKVVLLLGGSDKGSQRRAIRLARRRLKEFEERSP